MIKALNLKTVEGINNTSKEDKHSINEVLKSLKLGLVVNVDDSLCIMNESDMEEYFDYKLSHGERITSNK